MKKKLVFKKGSFQDFTREVRKFTLCALTQEKSGGIWADSSGFSEISKVLRIGLSIQGPGDSYDENLGEIISEGKAIKKPIITLCTDNKGVISGTIVEALLEQEARYFIKNPGKYIASYNKHKAIYEATKSNI
jgi:hypothetical protein